MSDRFIDEFDPIYQFAPKIVSRREAEMETRKEIVQPAPSEKINPVKNQPIIKTSSIEQVIQVAEPTVVKPLVQNKPTSINTGFAFNSNSLGDLDGLPAEKPVKKKIVVNYYNPIESDIDLVTGMIDIPQSFSNVGIKQSLPQAEIEVGDRSWPFERVNANQVKYKPLSQINPTGAVIPSSMAEPTMRALMRLNERVGDIDHWVGERLHWSKEQIAQYVTSEQVDAVALGIDAADRGDGLIIADSTGFGKGRILACIARAMVLSGKNVNFLTEKANLFSDFWRDIRDIGSEDLFRIPFIFNDGAKIVDTASKEAKVLIPAWKKALATKVIQSCKLPDNTPLSMSSYSQYSRKGRKTECLSGIAHNAHFVFDEAHNFVGDSTTRKTTGEALSRASSSTYSSATFGRDINNLSAYTTVFPWLSRIGDLNEFTPAQRRALAEESVILATEAGNIIRREHDLTNMVLTLLEDEQNLERNEEFSDNLAPVLSVMAKLARNVDMLVKRKNEVNQSLLESLTGEQRKMARETWFAANFGSRLNALIGQFLVALQVDPCVDQCIETLLMGEKPVVVIESTMESLMRELAQEAKEDEPDAELDLSEDEPTLPDLEEELVEVSAKPPTFREALIVMANRMLRVSVRRGAAYEKEIIELNLPELISMRDEIIALASEFPDLSLSPIDDIRDRVEAKGAELFEQGKIKTAWIADEISARSMRVVDGKYVPMPSHDRNVSVAKFVNGSSHCLVLTNAAATGLSLHDSEKFAEHARRHMILLRPPRNVVLLIQMLGRVLRRGQITEPRFTMLSTGLPFQTYELAMQRRKIEGLSASVTGSGQTATSIDVFDPIDALGNNVAYDLLMENQKLADHLGVPMKIDREEADKEFYFVGKFLKRLPLLRAKQQRAAFNMFMDAYKDRMKTDIGVHSGRNLEGVWKQIKREILEVGDGTSDPLTGRDLFVTTISSTKQTNPIRSTQIASMIESNLNNLSDRKSPYADWLDEIKEKRDGILQAALHRKYKTVQAALKSSEENSVKLIDNKLAFMSSILEKLHPGVTGILPGDDGELQLAVITDVSLPQLARATKPREYKISYIFPGDEAIRTISLESLVRDTRLSIINEHSAKEIYRAFDSAPSGTVEVERKILDGNGLAAVMASRRMKVGTRTSYTDQYGRQRSAILIAKSAEHALANQPAHTASSEIAYSILMAGGKIWTNQEVRTLGATIDPARNGLKFEITIPHAVRDSKVFETAELIALTGKFDGGNWIIGRQTTVDRQKIAMAVKMIGASGNGFFYDPQWRKLAVEKSKSMKSRNTNVFTEENQIIKP